MAKILTIDKGLSQTFQVEMAVASGTTASIAQGTPTKMATAKAAIMADANGTTSELFTGLAKGVSTETASAAGTVELWAPVPGLVYRGFSKTAANSDTQGEINALIGKRVIFDLTSSDWTVDDGAADATTHCVAIVGGMPQTSELQFIYGTSGTYWGNPTT